MTTPAAISLPDARPPIPDPRPIEWVNTEIRIILPDRLPEGDDWVMYGLTQRDYDTLAKNMADVRRWVNEAAWRLRYYRGEDDGENTKDEGE